MADAVQAPTDTLAARLDSLLIVARGRAEYARDLAVAAGATPEGLAPGDSLRAQAESLAAAGQKPEAAVLFERATSLWAAAVPPAQFAAEPAPLPSIPPRRPGPTLPAGSGTTTPTRPGGTQRPEPGTSGDNPGGLPDSVAVTRFYVELQQAIRSRQLGEVRRLLPNLNENEEREWRGLFEDERIATLEPLFEVSRVNRENDVVYARVREQLTLVRTNGKIEKKRDRRLWTRLTLGPQGWRQIRAEKAPD